MQIADDNSVASNPTKEKEYSLGKTFNRPPVPEFSTAKCFFEYLNKRIDYVGTISMPKSKTRFFYKVLSERIEKLVSQMPAQ